MALKTSIDATRTLKATWFKKKMDHNLLTRSNDVKFVHQEYVIYILDINLADG